MVKKAVDRNLSIVF